MSTVGYSTAGALINRAAVQLGLQPATDPYASTDPSFIQLTEFLTVVGEELAQFIKPHIEKSHSILTAGSALSYDLPADFAGMVDGTGWDTNGPIPMAGPISATTDAQLVANGATSTVSQVFRIRGNTLTFPVAPGNGRTFTLRYISSRWVQANASLTPDKVAPTLTNDWICFDQLLVIRALKYHYMTAKGFDTSVAFTEYRDRRDHCIGKNAGARPLPMVGGGVQGTHFIDGYNVGDQVLG